MGFGFRTLGFATELKASTTKGTPVRKTTPVFVPVLAVVFPTSNVLPKSTDTFGAAKHTFKDRE